MQKLIEKDQIVFKMNNEYEVMCFNVLNLLKHLKRTGEMILNPKSDPQFRWSNQMSDAQVTKFEKDFAGYALPEVDATFNITLNPEIAASFVDFELWLASLANSPFLPLETDETVGLNVTFETPKQKEPLLVWDFDEKTLVQELGNHLMNTNELYQFASQKVKINYTPQKTKKR